MIAASDILDFYFQHNLRVVYWPRVGDNKGPQQVGWTERIFTREEYADHLRVGFMCGHEISPGKFLTDLDLDWADGAKIALALLPKTGFLYGRASKPISHCVYTTTAPLPSFRYEDPTDNMCLLEIRGTKIDGTLGNQSMCPPSIWSKEGAIEALQFVRMQLPAHFDAMVLRQAGCLSAVGMLLARHFGIKGFGHDQRVAWAGFLLRAGISVDECIAMGNAIIEYTRNDDKNDIRLVVESTRKRLDSKENKKVQGGPTLIKFFGDKGKLIVGRINQWLGRDSDFIRNKDGIIIKDNYENIFRALRMIDVEMSQNMFSGKKLINRTSVLEDDNMNRMWFRIDSEFRFRPSREYFENTIKDLAFENQFHPVREYLDNLVWDKIPRLDLWLVHAANASNTPYVRAVSSIVLIAAVKRIRSPGCKYDEMLVLESEQGLQKSSALRALCPNPDWFLDDFELTLDSKRIIELTQGKWIIEVSELSGLRAGDIETLKSNLSRQVDTARMAYARLPIERYRQFILIGTTNSKAYLADPTGARRFWPMDVKKFNVEWIEQYRDQLWAEASAREASGESIRLHESLWCAAGEEQEKRRELDPWESLVVKGLLFDEIAHTYRDGYTRVLTSVVWDYIMLPQERRSKRDQMRVTDIMQRLGFKRAAVRPAGAEVQQGFISLKPHWVQSQTVIDNVEDMHASEKPVEDDIPF